MSENEMMQPNRCEKWIKGGTIVLSDRTLRGHVQIRNGKIAHIFGIEETTPAPDAHSEIIDATGWLVLPGMIDLHGDAIEKEVQPRPHTMFPIEASLLEMEKKLAATGITTMYHSLSLGTGLSLYGLDKLEQLVEAIERRKQQRAMIRHRLHLRYEVLYTEFMDKAEQWLRERKADYFSYMIHAPGIGQYKRPGSFAAYVMKNQGINQEEVDAVVKDVERMAQSVDWSKIAAMCKLAQTQGIAIASHDDDSPADIERATQLGVSVSEFPLNIQTAKYARANNLHVCVGAPNVVRGQSHDRNMRAIDAIQANSANILCSDYYPPAMLQAVNKLAQRHLPLHEAVNMVSLHPARAVGIDATYGSLEPGKTADLLLVEPLNDYLLLRRTIISGETVYTANMTR